VSRPLFCPNCAAALPTDERANAAVPIYSANTNANTGDGGYDCYCESCGWSGDIYPEELAISRPHNTSRTSPPVGRDIGSRPWLCGGSFAGSDQEAVFCRLTGGEGPNNYATLPAKRLLPSWETHEDGPQWVASPRAW
jgi:hypothetical protein